VNINKESFIEELIQTILAHHENMNVTYNTMNYSKSDRDKFCAAMKLSNKLSDKIAKMTRTLAKDHVFAKEVLEKLIEISDTSNVSPYVAAGTASKLWLFNYRMEDCHRLFEYSLALMPNNLSKMHVTQAFKNIVSGNNPYFNKQRAKFPKLE